MMNDAQYLIWSCDRAQWWKPGARGYSADIAEAGKFGHAEAHTICWEAMVDGDTVPRDVMVPAAALGRQPA